MKNNKKEKSEEEKKPLMSWVKPFYENKTIKADTIKDLLNKNKKNER